MNCDAELDPDYSEFVEVDPTGRYGRVISKFSCFFLTLILFFLFFFSSFSIDSVILQYNEILGKGSSKTVYETFLHNLLKFLKNGYFIALSI